MDLYFEAVGEFQHENIVTRGPDHSADIPSESEIPRVLIVSPVLGPHQVEDGPGSEFPS